MQRPSPIDTEDSPRSVDTKMGGSKGMGRLFPWLLLFVFLVAGVIVAVQMTDGAAEPAAQFEALQIDQPEKSALGNDGTETDPAADTTAQPIDDLTGRLANMISDEAIEAANHPLEPLLELAQEGLKRIDQNIADYTATVISRVQIDGNLESEKRFFCKIRHATPPQSQPPSETDTEAQTGAVPFSIYLKMLSPSSIAGQEVIWIDGQNENKLIAHAGGMLNLKRVYLEPTGSMAMQGNRHPIHEIGFRNLIKKMDEVGQRDLKYDDCIVNVTRDVSVNDRTCTLVEIKHENKQPHFEFHIAKIYIDQQIDVLLGYEGYDWPKNANDPPVLLEKYFYTDLKLNVGMTDDDFSPSNKAYQFPMW